MESSATSPLSTIDATDALAQHFEFISSETMRDMFDGDAERFERFHLQFNDLLLDYSKNRINQETLRLLFQLARSLDIEAERDRMFQGDRINITENRAVLHTALRDRSGSPRYLDGKDVMPDISAELAHMASFSASLENGDWRGCKGDVITDIVNIGIGGSDLGPKMVCQALEPYKRPGIRVHFVSNVDGTQIEQTLKDLNPATSLFIVVSKTFTTQETMTNAQTAKRWFLEQGQSAADVSRHFVAVSTNRQDVEAFGISAENMFGFWDWVGGRYSLWSSVGLSIMLMIGERHFNELLQGAHEMDRHFAEQPLEQNMPVILALIGYWYRRFFNTSSQVILPYDHHLRALPAYLQQAEMESNGKSVGRDGQPVSYGTAPVLWGDTGINGQHSFYQLLHQGTDMIPVDFIATVQIHNQLQSHQDILTSNVIAQSEALMRGRTREETLQMLSPKGELSDEDAIRLPHMVFEGNRPSNTMMLTRLTPRSLGTLIALYEHKIFVQGVLWNLNSFDQWGVELGKQLARNILPQLNTNTVPRHDNSTSGLILHYRRFKGIIEEG